VHRVFAASTGEVFLTYLAGGRQIPLHELQFHFQQ